MIYLWVRKLLLRLYFVLQLEAKIHLIFIQKTKTEDTSRMSTVYL